MNGQQLAPMTVGFAIAVVLILVIGFFRRKRNMIAHLAPVKRELKKENGANAGSAFRRLSGNCQT